jgi:hypothetical protein
VSGFEKWQSLHDFSFMAFKTIPFLNHVELQTSSRRVMEGGIANAPKPSLVRTLSISPCRLECEERWVDIETNLLHGQKLQGTLTVQEVRTVLEARGAIKAFPLMAAVHDVAFGGKPVETLLDGITGD